MLFNVQMTIECDVKDYQELKATFENHIDYLLDLESWPEIKDVFQVTTSDEKIIY